MHSLRAVPLLLLTVLAKAEFPSPFHPVADQNPSCPGVRHYYRRLTVGHGSDAGEAGKAAPGKCHRCYCKEAVNGTAACWPREDKLCDGVGRSRARRSIFGFTDLIFGNAASKLFKEELPNQCVPKTSFSDGCPPADWCMGCTVCDCDSKGQWDCHILSFCNGDEKKKRINGSKVPVPKSIKTRKKQRNRKKYTTKAVTKKATKPQTKRRPLTTKKPIKQTKQALSKPKDLKKNQTKPKKVVVKKVKKIIFKPINTKRPKTTKKPNSTKRTKPTKKPKTTKHIKRTKSSQKPKTTRNPKPNKHIKKTLEPITDDHRTSVEPITHTTHNLLRKPKGSKTQIRKVLHRVLSKRESNPNLNEISDVMAGDSLEQTEMGRKIVKKVISTLEKLMAKQMAMIQNKTNILRSQYKDCAKVKEIKKTQKKMKAKPKRKTKQQMTIEEINQRKIEAYMNRNSWRVKREAFDIAELTSVTQNNNESKTNEVTAYADVEYLVKELAKPTTAPNVQSNVINATETIVSDSTKNRNDSTSTTERTTGTTELITNSNTPKVIHSTEYNLKYYEYLPNILTTSYTDNVIANSEHTENNTTEIRLQNASLNKSIYYTTQISLTKDPNNKSLHYLDKNDTVQNYTILNTKNIHEKSKGTPNEYTYYTSQITTPDNTNSINNYDSKIVSDEIKIIQSHTEKSKYKQRNKTEITKVDKKYDDFQYKKDKINKDKYVNKHHEHNNVTTPNKLRIANGSINDADLIKRIKNKIKNRYVKKKFGSVLKNNTKKGMVKLDKIVTVSSSTDNNITSNATNTNIIERRGSLQNLLEKLINQKKDSVSQFEKKPKYSVFKYLRNIFKKIFSNKRDNHTTHKTNEGYTLEVLCDNVGACFKNDHIKVTLRSKLHDLNSETEKVFKTIKIIKSLLHLIDIPTNVSNDSTEKTLSNDIQKLNAILKGNYYETNTLTVREKSQIRIVKENIHNFIASVGKFASILHEVLDELYKNNKKYACQRNLRLNKKHNSQKTLSKIKKLLINYNVVQNTFMKRIFQLIKNAENNTSSETPLKPINNDRSLNDTPVIDTYTTNIIEHLRKLKNLAQAINSTRTKRWTSKNSDAMEVMLLMLEYLIKQNQPLEKNPANDGIDLLIEAIQNAPSIKSIQKKVLKHNYNKLDITPTRSTIDARFYVSRSTLATPTTSELIDSEPVKRSNEDDMSETISLKDNSESRDENILGDRDTDPDDDIIQKVYQRGIEHKDNSSIDLPETPEENVSLNDTVEKVGIPKFVNNLVLVKPDNDTINSDEDENNYLVAGITATETEAPSEPSEVYIETTVPWEDYKLDLIPVTNKDTNLDWIEENFGKEIEDYRSADIPTTMTPVSLQTVTRTSVTTAVPNKSFDNISGMSVEIEQEKKPKVITDLILRRKEMELLNSLDYGTEIIPEFDESISKDEVKSADNSFPAYFL